jgi:hypothetical protein
MTSRTVLSPHDRALVKRAVTTELGGGYRQVYQWAGEGFKEHWADSIALGVATAREGVIDTEWLFEVKMAVYQELGLSASDVPVPVRR